MLVLKIFKKYFFAILTIFSSFLSANEEKKERFEKLTHPYFECKLGYFAFSGRTMREIYDQGGIDVQMSTTFPFGKKVHLYTSLEYLEKQGSSLFTHEPTKVFMLPFSFGIKAIYELPHRIQCYYSLGPKVFLIHQHNFTQHVNKKITDGGGGGFVNVGLNFFIYKNSFFDFFAEYSILWTKHQTNRPLVYERSIQVGGYTFGGSVGVKF